MWGKTSGDFESASKSGKYPNMADMLSVVPASALALTVFKVIAEKMVLAPLMKGMVVRSKTELPFVSKEMESMYQESKPALPDINRIKTESSILKRSVEELNNWFRARQRQDRDTIKVRVCCESAWRFIMYSLCVASNLKLMKDEGITVANAWDNLPFQESSTELRHFYSTLELPLYVVLLFFQLLEGRKAHDMWEMSTHHLLVVLLIGIVYTGNFLRIGLYGLILHDVTDLFLESSKLANYLKFRKLADLLFTGFAFSWGYSRIYKFTTVVLPSVTKHGRDVSGDSFTAVTLLLGVLYFLNLYWFWKIAKLWLKLFWVGNGKERQQRAMTDLSTDDEVDSDSSFFSDGSTLKRHED